ncbi:hypothetical protein [Pseudomonas purpurea]|uniref:hypothetical protein n=1 Tax=Pseudomonas purpurea TaxID=3136737 RepID=UPI003267AC02
MTCFISEINLMKIKTSPPVRTLNRHDRADWWGAQGWREAKWQLRKIVQDRRVRG